MSKPYKSSPVPLAKNTPLSVITVLLPLAFVYVIYTAGVKLVLGIEMYAPFRLNADTNNGS